MGHFILCEAHSVLCWDLLCRPGLTPLCPCVPGRRSDTSVDSFLSRGQLWMRRLPDSCAGTDCDPCCQVTERTLPPFFFFFFTPVAPWALLSAYRQLLPCRASMTKHTSGFNSSLCTGLAGPCPAFALLAEIKSGEVCWACWAWRIRFGLFCPF